MTGDDRIYRLLQQHLDRQPVSFPKSRSGADLRLLCRLFETREAELALQLSYRPLSTDEIVSRAGGAFAVAEAEALLDSMFMRGSLGRKKRDGVVLWYLIPLVVGMYESQDGLPTPEFLADASSYMNSLSYAKSFVAARPSQMRTVPVNISIPIEHHVATYDHIRCIVAESPPPFAVLPCICRYSAGERNEPCQKTSRAETCLTFCDTAKAVLRRGHGREISREELLSILQQNEDEGLVLQPAGAQQPEFVCSCCGCCCGMLNVLKKLPRPVDFWTCNFQAHLEVDVCTACGLCVSRCQIDAISLTGPEGKARVNHDRCIGCGLCVSGCPAEAIRIEPKEEVTVPPRHEEDLYDALMENKQSTFGQWLTLLKLILRIRPSSD